MSDDLVLDRCPFCKEEIHIGDAILHEVTGWERTRKQGGANMIHLRQRTGKLAHHWCVEKAGRGLIGQAALWND